MPGGVERFDSSAAHQTTMSRHADINWMLAIDAKRREREQLITRLRLRIAKAELEGKPTDGLRIMLRELEEAT